VSASTAAKPGDPLTRREVEVLELTAAGLTTEEIGGKLALSRHTVKSHLRRVYIKLEVRGAAHAVAVAYTTRIFAVRPGIAARVKPGYVRHVPKSSVVVPRRTVELLEACARAASSGHAGAASQFAAQALDALADAEPVDGAA
jgi:DNA-binding CsgD family transcriptional regulator